MHYFRRYPIECLNQYTCDIKSISIILWIFNFWFKKEQRLLRYITVITTTQLVHVRMSTRWKMDYARVVKATGWERGFLRHPYISTTQRLTDFPKIRVNRPVCSRGDIVEIHRQNWMNDRERDAVIRSARGMGLLFAKGYRENTLC